MTTKLAGINLKMYLLTISTIILLLVFSPFEKVDAQNVAVGGFSPLSAIQDGDLIRGINEIDVYIVKINSGRRYRRVILNPAIFNSYGQLSWDNIKTVTSETINSFVPSQLVREVDESGNAVDGRVFMLFDEGDTGTKRFINLDEVGFVSGGGNERYIFNINSTEASENFYATGTPITSSEELRRLLDTSIREEIRITGGEGASPSAGEAGSSFTTRSSRYQAVSFSEQTLQPPIILPGTEESILSVNASSIDSPITIKRLNLALSPVSGSDLALENTFEYIRVVVDGSEIASKDINSSADYSTVLNRARISFDELDIDIEEDESVLVNVYAGVRDSVGTTLLKDWNSIIESDDIYSLDENNRPQYNKNPMTNNFLVRTTKNRDTGEFGVGGFRATTINTDSLIFEWREYPDAIGYEFEYCTGVSCTNFGNRQIIRNSLTKAVLGLEEGVVYKFRIRAIKGDDVYSVYRTILQATILSAPVLAKGPETTTTIDLSWNRIERADGYIIEKCERVSLAIPCVDYSIHTTLQDNLSFAHTVSNLKPSTVYQFNVKALGRYPKLSSVASNEILAATDFLPPANFRAQGATFLVVPENVVTLLWDIVPLTERYSIEYCAGLNCVPNATIVIDDASVASRTFNNLSGNEYYTFAISTFNYLSGESEKSVLNIVTKLDTVSGFTRVTPSPESVFLTWDPVEGAIGYLLQVCVQSRTPNCLDSDYETLYEGTALSYLFTDVVINESYIFRVKALSDKQGGDSKWEEDTFFGGLDTPSNVRVTSFSDNSLTLEWGVVEGAFNYDVGYCAGANCTPRYFNSTRSNDATSITIPSLNQNTLYRMRVQAIGVQIGADSDWSSVVEKITRFSTPASFTSTAQTGESVSLRWGEVSSAYGYVIEYCDGLNCIFDEEYSVIGGSTTTAEIPNLTPRSLYRFRIKTVGIPPESDSEFSGSISASTILGAPQNLRFTSITDNSMILNWDIVSGATRYDIESCSGAGCTPTTYVSTTNGISNSVAFSLLSPDTLYRVRIKSIGVSTESEWSSILGQVTLSTPIDPDPNDPDPNNPDPNDPDPNDPDPNDPDPNDPDPNDPNNPNPDPNALAVPTNLRITSITSISMTLAWSTVNNADGYTIQYCDGINCTFDQTYNTSSGATSTATITGLTTTNAHKFRIKATGTPPEVDSAYSSAILASLDLNLTPDPNPNPDPNNPSNPNPNILSAPENFRSTSVTATSVSLGWDVVANADGYTVEYCDGVGCTFDQTYNVSSGATSSATITGLTTSNIYRFRMKATGNPPKADSPYSIVISASSNTNLLDVPQNLRVVSITDTSMILVWSTVSNADGYTIQYCDGQTCTFDQTYNVLSGSTSSTAITGLTTSSVYRFRIKATGLSPKVDSAYSAGIFASSVLTTNPNPGDNPNPDPDASDPIDPDPNDPNNPNPEPSVLAVPQNLRATSVAGGLATLAWSTVINADGYTLQYCDGQTCTFDQTYNVQSGSTSTATITGLTSNTVYRFRIKATGVPPKVDSAYSAGILVSSNLNLTPDPNPNPDPNNPSNPNPNILSAPENFRSNIVVGTSIYLLWNVVANADGYTIEYCDGVGCTFDQTYNVQSGTTSSATITGLTTSNIYRFRMKATGNPPKADSPYSIVISASSNPNLLGVPQNLKVISINETSMTLAWSTVGNADGYTIQYCDGQTCTFDQTYNVQSGSTSSTTITGLTPTSVYRFRIKSNGNPPNIDSEYSVGIFASSVLTTNPNPGDNPNPDPDASDPNNPIPDALDVPQNLRVTSITSGSMTFAWSTVTNADGYTIQYCDGVSCTFDQTQNVSSGSTSSATITGLTTSNIYRFRIKATGNPPKIDSAYSSVILASTNLNLTPSPDPNNPDPNNPNPDPNVLAVPQNFRVDSFGGNVAIILAWSTVSNADRYEIQYCDGAGCAFDQHYHVPNGTTGSASITGVNLSNIYRFRIKAVGDSPKIDSLYSMPISTSSNSNLLDTPENLRAISITETSITLAWSTVSNADGYTIQYCDGQICTFDQTANILGGSISSATISGLSSNAVYKFSIKATGGIPKIDSEYSTTIYASYSLSFTPVPDSGLASPKNLRAGNFTSTGMDIFWSPVANANGYVLSSCLGENCTFDEEEVISSVFTISYSLTGLQPDTIYNFKIKATGEGGLESLYSEAVRERTAIPIPSNFRVASSSETSISLAWNEVSGATGYTIQYCNGLSSCVPSISSLVDGGSTTEVEFSAIIPNTVYKFRIKATAEAGKRDSGYSSIVNSSTLITAPTNLSVSAQTSSTISLSWNIVSGATGYAIQYCGGVDCEFAVLETVTSGLTTSKTITGLMPNTVYRFRIKTKALFTAGDSEYSLGIEQRTSLAVPQNLSSLAQTSTSITVQWDEVEGADGYTVEHCEGILCFVFDGSIDVVGGSTTNQIVMGLTPGVAYRFRVKANGGAPKINSGYSEVFSEGTVIGTPQNFELAERTGTTIRVTWDAVDSASGYELYVCFVEGCTPNVIYRINGGSITSYTFTNFSPNSFVGMRIRAVSTSSVAPNSLYSTTIETRTAINTPENFRKTAFSEDSITLSWDASVDPDGYSLDFCEGAVCTPTFLRNLESDVTTTTVTGLDPVTEYRFRIKATGEEPKIDSPYSDILTQNTNIDSPDSISVDAIGPNSAMLSWDASEGAYSYLLAHCIAQDCVFDQISGSSTSTEITDLSSDTLYNFKVASIATVGGREYEGTITDPVYKRTTIDMPTNFRVRVAQSDSIFFNWNSVDVAESHTIEYCEGSNCVPSIQVVFNDNDEFNNVISNLTPGALYRFRIKADAVSGSVDSPYSQIIEDTTSFTALGNLRSTLASPERIVIAWDGTVPGANAYEVNYCHGNGCIPNLDVTINDTTLNTYEFTDVIAGETSVFRIRGINWETGNNSRFTNPITVKASISTPSNFRVISKTQSSVSFAWDAVTGANGYRIIGCEGSGCTPTLTTIDSSNIGCDGADCNTEIKNTIFGGTTTSSLIDDLTPDTTYRFIITATHENEAGNSDDSNIVEATTDDYIYAPDPPGTFIADRVSGTSITVAWGEVINADVYFIRWCDRAGCTPDTTKLITDGTTTTSTFSSLTPGTTYRFQISTNSESNNYSSIIDVTTTSVGIPLNFRSTQVAYHSIDLAWGTVSGANGYTIRWCEGAGCTPDTLSLIGSETTTTTTFDSLFPGTTYRFQIKSDSNTPGQSNNYSDIIDVATAEVTAPSNFRNTQVTYESISLAWDQALGAEGYIIRWCDGSGCTPDALALIDGGSTTSKTFSLYSGVTYRFQVSPSYNDPGNNEYYSDIIDVTTDDVSPPTNLWAAFNSPIEITLFWDEGENIDGYKVRWCEGAGCTPSTVKLVPGTTADTTIMDSLSPETLYRFQVSPSVGPNDYYSDIIESSTIDFLPPSNFRTTRISDRDIALGWSPTPNIGGYKIRWCTGAGCTPIGTTSVPSGRTSFTISPLTPSTRYRFQITPVTDRGDYYSDIIEATTDKLNITFDDIASPVAGT